MRPATDVVKAVLQTEKAARIAASDQYLLEVASNATKPEIKHAVESLFKTKVLKVNTQVLEGKWRRLSNFWGRRPDRKKAVVTLAKGQKIEVKA
jgi:large subunit ribosomal protein L23